MDPNDIEAYFILVLLSGIKGFQKKTLNNLLFHLNSIVFYHMFMDIFLDELPSTSGNKPSSNDKDIQLLKEFDLNSEYGPCIGISFL